MTASPAPASMPSEAVLRLVQSAMSRDNYAFATKVAREIEALFAPILAENASLRRNKEWHQRCAAAQCERAEQAEARALAAEAAVDEWKERAGHAYEEGRVAAIRAEGP